MVTMSIPRKSRRPSSSSRADHRRNRSAPAPALRAETGAAGDACESRSRRPRRNRPDARGFRSRVPPAPLPFSGYSSISTFTTMPSSSSTRCDLWRLHADAVHGRTGRRKLHALGNLDPLLDAIVVRHHVLAAPTDAELADHRGCARFRTLTISPSARPPGLDARNPHHHAVAVHSLFGGLGRDEDVALNSFDGPVGNQKAVAVVVHVQAARPRTRGCGRSTAKWPERSSIRSPRAVSRASAASSSARASPFAPIRAPTA